MNDPAASRHRRTRRDRFVDTAMFLLAAAFAFLMSAERLGAGPLPPGWLFPLDQVVGALGCAALWLRRRWPVGLAVTLVALSAVFEMVAGPMLAALFSVAVHRRPRISGAVFAASVLAAVVFTWLRPEPDTPPLATFMLGLALQGAATGWGLFVHHRRRLVLAQRDRAARMETEARLRAEQAQHLVREAIAREMHDVLGHRLSLLSVHAGALEFNPGADPADVARAARVIRESAHQALQDLREVIGVLRAPSGGTSGDLYGNPYGGSYGGSYGEEAATTRPGPPGLADLGRLLAESGEAGMRVRLRDDLGGRPRETVPGRTGHTAYRVVQEALTNARRHAPGAEVRLRLAGAPGEGLTIEVVNDTPATGRPETRGGGGTGSGGGIGGSGGSGSGIGIGSGGIGSGGIGIGIGGTGSGGGGSGHGLAGLAERVALAGGRLEHGPVRRDDGAGPGDWHVRAWLPWPA
ncbi:sensor histidine kinase [Microbispora amethystogenes]|uniref:histidine kinase n=1 Tax=Microbispora amethystogenes TaxID=1427754 RepID=A0ABQ4FKW5_9ACTN|nr:histidine kinase [Microbispora amethystogenes]GIH35425.1 two-component sensor histidine kinase [Microbispora amethystogenes]